MTVWITPDDLPAANEPWAKRVLELLPARPDFAFTSENWGQGWAELMGARHIAIDVDRTTVPICATDIRRDLASHFHWLVPAARAGLARRVVLIGAESSGKSTLAEALARELRSVWVPEYGRWYWEGRRYLDDQSWSSDEFLRIARAQQRLTDDLARHCVRGIVVADTDAMVTAVWHERYLGCSHAAIEALADHNVPDLYLICRDDFPWVQDGTRESKEHRDATQTSLVRRAEASGAAVAWVEGSPEDRLTRALRHTEPFFDFDELR